MTTTESSQNMNSGFDTKAALKNYAATMAMNGLYFPHSFESNSSMYAAAAYSQASALAATMQNLNCHSPQGAMSNVSNGQNGNGVPMVSSTNGVGSSVGIPYSLGSAASFMSNSSSMPITIGAALSFPAHSTTPSTPKKKAQPVPDTLKDETYWERRKRNNESARRSRESRRAKEDQIAIRVVVLEQENLHLRTEIQFLKAEVDKLRAGLMYHGNNH